MRCDGAAPCSGAMGRRVVRADPRKQCPTVEGGGREGGRGERSRRSGGGGRNKGRRGKWGSKRHGDTEVGDGGTGGKASADCCGHTRTQSGALHQWHMLWSLDVGPVARDITTARGSRQTSLRGPALRVAPELALARLGRILRTVLWSLPTDSSFEFSFLFHHGRSCAVSSHRAASPMASPTSV